MKDKIKEYLSGKSILILGYGREGKAVFKLLTELNLIDKIGIADLKEIDVNDYEELKDKNIHFYSGEDYLKATKAYDIIIKSPGVIIKNYISAKEKKKITSATDLFLRFCPNKVIGVTGTKGKSTTASLIYHILKETGYDTLLMGNIGIPCFDMLDQIKPETIIVYELSCHQLEFVKASPYISVLLNVYEEHLDHYNSLADYVKAKKNIYKYQHKGDYLIYGDIFEHITKKEIDNLDVHKINLYDNPFDIDINKIETSLIGQHNLYNIILAVSVCYLLGLDKKKALAAVKSFTGLPHRLEYVGKFKKINFYNDSIATAQEAVINAVKSFDKVDTLIIGGMDRELNYTKLIDFLVISKVDNLILLPDTNIRINEMLEERKTNQKVILVKDMEEAVEVAFQVTREKGMCLLSPAAASYGFYKNFEERGEHFKDLVKNHA
jgi:UDP-N-acetylmuramoyl-L-alanine---L-glutamate ligase